MAKAFDPKAKAKRQKIIAAVGGVILVALLVWRVPQVIALMNKKPPPPPSSSAASAVPAPTSAGVPAVATPAAGAASSGRLIDTDGAPTPDAGQLVSFGRFVSKDPFAQQVGSSASETSTDGTGRRPQKPVKVPEPIELEPVAPAAPKPAASATVQISVNGETEAVEVGAAFPASDPVFKLVSAGRRSAKIAIAGGSYASGAATITIEKGKPVTLVNTADGTRYRLLLV